MSESIIASALRNNRALVAQMSVDAFASDLAMRGRKVALYRDYVSGDQRNFLTTQMRKQLNLPASPQSTQYSDSRFDAGISTTTQHDFSANYCAKVVNSMASRLAVDELTISGDNDGNTETLTTWRDGVLRLNRFDSVQNMAHDSALGDGIGFVFVDWDQDARRVKWTVEPFYDGTDGSFVIMDASGSVQLAVKIWQRATSGPILDTMRVNVYYPDRLERYISFNGGSITPYATDGLDPVLPWPAELGLTWVPFINRRKAYTNQGKSEIEDIIPLQDGLNRSMYSMVATAENTGFGVGFALGFKAPNYLAPGTMMNVYEGAGSPITSGDGTSSFFEPKFERAKGELPTAFVDTANWFVEQISVISDTPIPQLMGGSTSSGEALKQREAGLMAKINRAQTEFGNAWERCLWHSWKIEQTFDGGQVLPEPADISAKWNPAEVRSEAEVVTMTNELFANQLIDQRTALEAVAFVFNWSATDIDTILDRVQTQQANQNNALLTAGFNGFNPFG